jgi:6-methylsalicylic acid synthase
LPDEEAEAWLAAEVARQVAAEIKVPAAQIDARRPLADLGLDSVMFLIIRRRLSQRFRIELPATLLWTRPTVAAIADYLRTALRPARAPADPVEQAQAI